MYKVDNAIIMSAGTSSRFAPLSYEMPKALIEVRGEVLIERQIQQLLSAGISEIVVVTGYMHEMFDYLEEKFGVKLIFNNEFDSRNNNGSIWTARNYLRNSYVCSSDNYFLTNPFEREVEDSYYASVYSDGRTEEWCMEYDDEGIITSVKIGGRGSWYMMGHTFWNEGFSTKFLKILQEEYCETETRDKLWEKIYIEHIDELKMRIRKYSESNIFEFDTLDELRQFDRTYVDDTRSNIIKLIAKEIDCRECDITNILALKTDGNYSEGFSFKCNQENYRYFYKGKELIKE